MAGAKATQRGRQCPSLGSPSGLKVRIRWLNKKCNGGGRAIVKVGWVGETMAILCQATPKKREAERNWEGKKRGKERGTEVIFPLPDLLLVWLEIVIEDPFLLEQLNYFRNEFLFIEKLFKGSYLRQVKSVRINIVQSISFGHRPNH